MSSNKAIKVRVRDTQEIIFEDEVDRISSFNEIGPFDVYPAHANFITIIHRNLALYKQKMKIKELKLEQAVMKVKQDRVNIFLGIDTFSFDEDDLKDQTLSNNKV